MNRKTDAHGHGNRQRPVYEPGAVYGLPVDARSDIYGVGCLLYECLTLAPPFPADSGVACMYKHLHEPVSQAPDFRGLDHSIQAVIERMMAKNPEERYQSVDDLERDLDLLQKGKRISAKGNKRADRGTAGATYRSDKPRIDKHLGDKSRTAYFRETLMGLVIVVAYIGVCAATMLGFLTLPERHATTGDDELASGMAQCAPLTLPSTPRASYSLAEQMRMRRRPQDALTVLEHAETIFDRNARVGQPGYFSQMEMFRLKLMKENCLTSLARHKEAQQAAAEAIEASKSLDLPQQAEAQLIASHAALDAGDSAAALRFADRAESLRSRT